MTKTASKPPAKKAGKKAPAKKAPAAAKPKKSASPAPAPKEPEQKPTGKRRLPELNAEEATGFVERFFHDPRTPGTSGKIISVEGLDDDPPTIEVLLCRNGTWDTENTTYSKKDMRALNVL